jgi:hypothetical protein
MENTQTQTLGQNLKKSWPLLLLLLVFILVISGIIYAFTAANVVPATVAGEGRGAVTGHTVSNIAYDTTVNADPGTLETVTFDIDVAAGFAYVGLDVTGGGVTRWWACADATGGTTFDSWTCDITVADTAGSGVVVDIEDIVQLEVVTLE